MAVAFSSFVLSKEIFSSSLICFVLFNPLSKAQADAKKNVNKIKVKLELANYDPVAILAISDKIHKKFKKKENQKQHIAID